MPYPSGRVIGKVTPISYISKCHPLKSDAPSIRWHLIFFSCLFVDVLLSFLHHVALISQHLPQFTPFLYFTQLRFGPLFWAVVYWLLVKAILYLTLIVQKNAICILGMPGLAQPRSQGLSSLQSFLSLPLASVGREMREPGTRLEIAKVVCFHKKYWTRKTLQKI